MHVLTVAVRKRLLIDREWLSFILFCFCFGLLSALPAVGQQSNGSGLGGFASPPPPPPSLSSPAPAIAPLGPSVVPPPVVAVPRTDQTGRQSGQSPAAGLDKLPNFGSPPASSLQAPADSATGTAAVTPELPAPAAKPQAAPATSDQAATAAATASGPNEVGKDEKQPGERVFAKAQEVPGNGTYTYEYPIDTPKFRGLEPKLTLVFDSTTGLRPHGAAQGMLGTGWHIDGLSEITRVSRVHGAPRFNTPNTDVYLVDDQELIVCPVPSASPSCTSGGTHTTRVESYRRFKFDTAANKWLVTHRNGVVHTYSSVGPMGTAGTTPVNVQTNYRWLLTSMVDTHGNTVTYAYTCDQLPVCWPSAIAYNGTVLTLRYQARPDQLTSGRATVLSAYGKRLASIDIVTGGVRDQVYAMAYAQSPSTGLTRLTSVTTYGRDAVVSTTTGAVTAGSSLPPTTFAYTDPPAPAVLANVGDKCSYFPVGGPMGCGGGWEGMANLYGDFNGDGKVDRLTAAIWYYSDILQAQFAAGNASGSYPNVPLNTPWNTQVGEAPQGWCYQQTIRSARWFVKDIDGDGRDDIIRDLVCTRNGANDLTYEVGEITVYKSGISASGALTLQPYLVTYSTQVVEFVPHEFPIGDFEGTGRASIIIPGFPSNQLLYWTGSGMATKPFNSTLALSQAQIQIGPVGVIRSQYFVGDFNGDGKADILQYDGTIRLWRSTGSGLELAATYTGVASTPVIYLLTNSAEQPVVGDFNGDGISDIAIPKPQGAGVYAINFDVYYGTGSGLQRQNWGVSGSFMMQQVLVADVDGDGRSDIIVAGGSDVVGSPYTRIFLGRENGFVAAPASFNVPPTDIAIAVVDINGDGRADIIHYNGTNVYAQIRLSTGPAPDLLSQITNDHGGKTRVTYKPSSDWVNDRMPAILQTVASVELDNGLGVIGRNDFSYSGGFYDSVERRFLGFRNARAVLPCNPGETLCPERYFAFQQDVASAGAVKELEYWTGPKPGVVAAGVPTGVMLRKDVNTWTVNTNAAALPYTARNIASDRNEYDGGATKTSRTERTFDAYNNIQVLIEKGDTADATDDKRLVRQFFPNTAAYIVERQGSEAHYRVDGTIMSETRFSYDGAASYTTPPLRGDVTQAARSLVP
jgi:Insecticide toxin TcdB middle/N-terminal region/Salmonella virulence plasmid 65kDa B protein/FG-GAP-like repeat